MTQTRIKICGIPRWRDRFQYSDAIDLRVSLRARSERPSGRCAAKKRNEFAPSHFLPEAQEEGILPAQYNMTTSLRDVRLPLKPDITSGRPVSSNPGEQEVLVGTPGNRGRFRDAP